MTKRIATELVVVAILVAAVVGLWSEGVPGLSECGYLLAGYRTAHREVLATDWTFGTPVGKTLYFDLIFGALASVLSLEATAWTGRLIAWSLILLGMIRVGQRVGLRPVLAWAVVLAWLAFGQSLVGGERPVEHFVPRTIAWAAGIWAVERFLASRWVAAGVLLGLCVGAHASVGLALSLGIAAALLAERHRPAAWIRVVGAAVLAALPGIVPTLGALAQPGTDLRAEWQFQAWYRHPVHLDLASFPARHLAALTLAVLATAAIAWLQRRDDRQPDGGGFRRLAWILAGPTVVFGFGVIATATGRFEWLAIFPFRVLPVLAPWFLLIGVAVAVQAGWRSRPALGALAVAAVVALLSPSPRAVFIRYRLSAEYAARPDTEALRWVAANTEPTAVVLVSPVRRCAPYLTRRPQPVYFDLARLDRLREWRERLLALVGPLEPRSTGRRIDEAFHTLSPERVEAAVRAYGGDYLVSRGRYQWPVAFERGGYRVYDLRAAVPRP